MSQRKFVGKVPAGAWMGCLYIFLHGDPGIYERASCEITRGEVCIGEVLNNSSIASKINKDFTPSRDADKELTERKTLCKKLLDMDFRDAWRHSRWECLLSTKNAKRIILTGL